jgi:hypothetical protein
MSSICSSNLTSGFIDLATYDEQEKYLYGGPDAVAYFVREIRKATWFTQVPVCLSSRSGQPGFGQQWSVSISRAGDYLLHTWLALQVGAVTLAGPANAGAPVGPANGDRILRWTRNFGHNLIQECAITFNDLVAARFDNYHLDFWAAFTVPEGKRLGYDKMIGNIQSVMNPGLQEGVQPSLPAFKLNVPLPFFFSRDSGMALPTAALPYNEMRITFAFRNLSDLLTIDTYNAGTGSWSSTNATVSNLVGNTDQILSNVNVWANYAIVSNDERKKMACAPRDILIEQVQTAPTQSLSASAPQYDIRFSHSIKALFWAARNKTVSSCWSVYSDSNPVPAASGFVNNAAGNNPLDNTSLIYENTQRLYQMPSEYFALVNPWFHAPIIPSGDLIGYNLYSYSLDFFAIDPMGSTNYGKLTNVSIIPQTTAAVSTAIGAGNQRYDFITTAVNNNIIRISGGALGFPVL